MNNFKIDVKTCKYLPSGEIRKVLVQYIPKDFLFKSNYRSFRFISTMKHSYYNYYIKQRIFIDE